MSGEPRADLLVELGVEELPAPFLTRALSVLPGAVDEMLSRERLEHGEVRVVGTPRRIGIVVRQVAGAQPDETRNVTGPPEKVAVDPETGKFTKAALKFAARFGAGEEDLSLVDGPRGRVAGITVREEGKGLAEVVAALLPELFGDRTIPYHHSMRWCEHTGPFIRPVHWLLVLHGDRVLDAEMFGIRSGRETMGHRFHAPGPHPVKRVDEYEKILEKAHVLVDPERRRERLVADLQRCADDAGARIVEDEELTHEVVQLTEWPVPVLGAFQERFLQIPEDIVITAMAVHQRYFALRSTQDGRLLPAFIAVANTEPRDEDVVKRGFERVLTARLEDARFCHDEDLKGKLSDLVGQLEGMVFQARLGTYLDKSRRLETLCPALLRLLGEEGIEEQSAKTAARLCKADLLTRVVYEFPELQGIMGGVYATNEGLGDGIAGAIRDHYRPEGPSDELPGTRLGLVLSVADKVDTLTGFFALGKKPRGGSDPFGLRRACLGIVRILLELGQEVRVTDMVDVVYPMLSGFKLKASHEQVKGQILEFLEGRLRVLWREQARADILDACLACGVDDVVTARKRLLALSEFQKTEEFEDLSVAFKRAYRIVRDAEELPERPDPDLYEQPQEGDLHRAVQEMEKRVGEALAGGEFSNAFNEFRKLRAPVDAFFDEVYVNVEDQAIRSNRLALLSWIVGLMQPAARLDLIQFERTRLDG